MGHAQITILVFSTLFTAVFHTLIPDHWLPFALIGRARNWTMGRAAAVSGCSAFLHIALSLILGFGAIAIGLGTSLAIGETLEKASGSLLVLFGILYAFWSWRKGGHFHILGARVHRHEYGEDSPGHGDERKERRNPDEDIISGTLKRSDWYLAFIIGLNPCIIIFPILFAAVPHGSFIVMMIAAFYAVSTFLMMIMLTLLGLTCLWTIRMEFFSKYGEILSGILISCTGLLFLFLEP